MTTRHLLDPELTAAIDALPQLSLDRATLPALRAMVAQERGLQLAAMPAYPTIAVTEQRVPGPPGAPLVRVLVYRPRAAAAPMPALLWIHGGGYVVGDPEADDWEVKKIVEAVGCCVVSVDYRLAPETPHPGPVEDCHAALAWLHREAEVLGVDRRTLYRKLERYDGSS